jgi:small conductance mechanosensitive channel
MKAWIDNLELKAMRELITFFKPALDIILILAAAWLALALTSRLLRVFKQGLLRRSDDPEEVKRAETMAQVLKRVAALLIYVTAGMLVLSELGISLAPILATAGVAGIAAGFAAQSLVKDYFTGFVMLAEDQLHRGDVVEVAGKAGLVEAVSLRYVRLRDYEGNVHFVPNSAITTLTNRSRGFAQAVMDVGIAYRENVDDAFAVMREVGAELRESPEFKERILDDLDIAGVDQWADSAVVLRCRLKVAPLEQWAVRREFLKRLKAAFDREGIEIPYPHVTVYAGESKLGEAPAFRVRPMSSPEPGAAPGNRLSV